MSYQFQNESFPAFIQLVVSKLTVSLVKLLHFGCKVVRHMELEMSVMNCNYNLRKILIYLLNLCQRLLCSTVYLFIVCPT